jgi:hypothetical protein
LQPSAHSFHPFLEVGPRPWLIEIISPKGPLLNGRIISEIFTVRPELNGSMKGHSRLNNTRENSHIASSEGLQALVDMISSNYLDHIVCIIHDISLLKNNLLSLDPLPGIVSRHCFLLASGRLKVYFMMILSPASLVGHDHERKDGDGHGQANQDFFHVRPH